jgi:hypothetical protein
VTYEKPVSAFWEEFARVQFDKLLLLSLLMFLYLRHAPDLWVGNVMGALFTLIQGQRWGRSPGPTQGQKLPLDGKW